MGKYLITRSKKYGTLRILTTDTELFVSAIDVARALGYKRPGDAVRDHCRMATQFAVPTQEGGNETTLFIPETEAYRFTDSCRLPAAGEYGAFLREELPAFRLRFATNEPQNVGGMNADFSPGEWSKVFGKNDDECQPLRRIDKASERLAAAKISMMIIMALVEVLDKEFGMRLNCDGFDFAQSNHVPGIPDALLPVIDSLACAVSGEE